MFYAFSTCRIVAFPFRFYVLKCECLGGYGGQFCTEQLDACEYNYDPCYPGVECLDLPPPANETGYLCGPCPPGFTGNGEVCLGENQEYTVSSTVIDACK